MAKHTAGPWTVDKGEPLRRMSIEPGIAEVLGWGKIPDANARLIAEAPALLKALETVRSYTRTMVEAECVAEEPWMRDLYALLDRINE